MSPKKLVAAAVALRGGRMSAGYAVVLAAVAILFSAATPARADTGVLPASGAGALGPDTITNVSIAGGNIIIDGASSGLLTGTFDATFTESFRDVVHADGSVDVHATVFLEGHSPCGTGSWTQALVVKVAPDGTFSGETASIDAAAATVPVRTQYSFAGTDDTFTYEGSYSCA